MIDKYKKLIKKINIIINWLLSPGLLGSNLWTIILIWTFIMALLISNYENSSILKGILLSVFAILYYSLFFIEFLMKSNACLIPKIFIGRKKRPIDVLKEFTNTSYIYGITIFSFITTICLFGVLVVFFNLVFELKNLSGSLFYNLLFLSSSIFTFGWFIYHLIFSKIPVKKIKLKLLLYIAISATISVLIWPTVELAIKPMVTYLSISYSWLIYIIEGYKIKAK